MNSLSEMLEVDAASFSFAAVLTSTAIAGIFDARRCYIPNWLTFGLMLSGLGFHLVMPEGRGWVFSCAGMCFGFAVLLPLFMLGGIGAADVKLLAGVGAWLGIHDVIAVFMVFGVVTGLYSAVLLLFTQERWNVLRRIKTGAAPQPTLEDVVRQDSSQRKRRVIPMAPAMAFALLVLALIP